MNQQVTQHFVVHQVGLITRKIQLLVGDKVTVELSEYDLGRGRITLREK